MLLNQPWTTCSKKSKRLSDGTNWSRCEHSSNTLSPPPPPLTCNPYPPPPLTNNPHPQPSPLNQPPLIQPPPLLSPLISTTHISTISKSLVSIPSTTSPNWWLLREELNNPAYQSDDFGDGGLAYERHWRFANPNLNRRGGFPDPNREARIAYPNHCREGGYLNPQEYRRLTSCLSTRILIYNPSRLNLWGG